MIYSPVSDQYTTVIFSSQFVHFAMIDNKTSTSASSSSSSATCILTKMGQVTVQWFHIACTCSQLSCQFFIEPTMKLLLLLEYTRFQAWMPLPPQWIQLLRCGFLGIRIRHRCSQVSLPWGAVGRWVFDRGPLLTQGAAGVKANTAGTWCDRRWADVVPRTTPSPRLPTPASTVPSFTTLPLACTQQGAQRSNVHQGHYSPGVGVMAFIMWLDEDQDGPPEPCTCMQAPQFKYSHAT